MNAEYDVVVVGAGVAGIGAGRVLHERGARYCLLEAKSRLGGRAWTDTETFPGLPWDRGCHWLHCASRNPLVTFADEYGFAYDSTFSFYGKRYVKAGARLGAKESTALDDAVQAALLRVAKAGADGLDVSAASIVPGTRSERWYPVFDHILGLISGSTPEELSALDYSRADDDGCDYPVRDGLGALVCRLGAGLEAHLSTPVTRIDWSSHTVRVGTEKGVLRAKSVIVTVSTSVLGARHIRFEPELPRDVAEAISNCMLGRYEKVAFLMDRPFGEELQDTYVTVLDAGSAVPAPVSLYLNPFGRAVVIAELGGSYLSGLLAEGEPALIDAATRALAEAFGNDVRGRIRRAAATQWTTDPHVLGAYSYARAGHASKRLILARPIGDRYSSPGKPSQPTLTPPAMGRSGPGWKRRRGRSRPFGSESRRDRPAGKVPLSGGRPGAPVARRGDSGRSAGGFRWSCGGSSQSAPLPPRRSACRGSWRSAGASRCARQPGRVP